MTSEFGRGFFFCALRNMMGQLLPAKICCPSALVKSERKGGDEEVEGRGGSGGHDCEYLPFGGFEE